MDEGVRLPNRSRAPEPEPTPTPKSKPPKKTVFVPSEDAEERRAGQILRIGAVVLAIAAVGAVMAMVYWPRLKPKPLDAVEKVAAGYLDALAKQDEKAASKLGTVEEPPGIASYRDVHHQKSGDRTIKGSTFAPLAGLHKRIGEEFEYDATAGRFTPKNALGLAAETLDALHAAKDEAKRSGMYEKMQSGDPNEIFESAEQLGKFSEKISDTILAPKRLIPTYKMLVEASKPPLPEEAKALALVVADDLKRWDGLLKRPFWTLKPDGPFIYEEAQVTANARDRLGSLGDPPVRLRLELVRFRLEGIDTGWKVVAASRIRPGDKKVPTAPAKSSYGDARRSPGESTSAPPTDSGKPG